MRFALSTEQVDFATELRKILDAAKVPGIARAWADGDFVPGRALLRSIADMGVFGLIVDEEHGGAGATAVDLVVALVELGRAGVPGPIVESAAAIPALLQHLSPVDEATLSRIADGSTLATIAFAYPSTTAGVRDQTATPTLAANGHAGATPSLEPGRPAQTKPALALDSGAADLVLHATQRAVGVGLTTRADNDGDTTGASPGNVSRAIVGDAVTSVDATRKLTRVEPGEVLADDADAIDYSFDVGVLGCAAQLLGAGRAMLDQSVAYAKARKQFGRPIGEFQAVKQQLADALIGLDLAEPLLYRAALTLDTADRARDVSAAIVACGDAAHRAARTALQVHGAIGYTAECDLSLWLTKTTALRTAWGTPDFHRARIATALRNTPPDRPA
ncbi:acyl-CoA dehydrogenase family protein [Nocardia camponoti]|uniref:Acyl-CoA dehydrogenase n=1 Tax=Nocardia camponoti TaxID=1616106 RepID=A0A917VC12_9NOCA|nr:acyl-CoA dehydrogenase family protein [Nocardia camponoti]GGK59791.1 acyl-CoA dehydrogenase [Nocardia camponoti]